MVMRGLGKHGGIKQPQHFSPSDNTDLPFAHKVITPRDKCSTVVSGSGGKMSIKSRSHSSRNCFKCQFIITSGLVECAGCGKCYHFLCEGLSKEIFKVSVDSQVKYECLKCKSQILASGAALVETLQGLQKQLADTALQQSEHIMNTCKPISEKMRELKSNLDNFVAKNESLEINIGNTKGLLDNVMERMDTLEAKSVYYNNMDDFDVYFDSKIKPLEDRFVTNEKKIKDLESKVKFDVIDTIRRKNKLIFENVPDEVDPINLIKELAIDLKIEGMTDPMVNYTHKWISRPSLGAPKNMVCIEFRYDWDKCKFLGKSIREKLACLESKHRFYGIKIYPDRSPAERRQHREHMYEAEIKNLQLTAAGDQEHIWIVKFGRVFKVKKRTPGVDL